MRAGMNKSEFFLAINSPAAIACIIRSAGGGGGVYLVLPSVCSRNVQK